MMGGGEHFDGGKGSHTVNDIQIKFGHSSSYSFFVGCLPLDDDVTSSPVILTVGVAGGAVGGGGRTVTITSPPGFTCSAGSEVMATGSSC